MTNERTLTKSPSGVADAAVDGLLRGVVGGVMMAIVLIVAGLFAGLKADFVLARFDPTFTGSALAGTLAHLASAGVYGAIFGLLIAPVARRLGSRLVLAGLVYGIILLLISRGLMASELGAGLAALPDWGWTAAHLIYGATLGWLMARR